MAYDARSPLFRHQSLHGFIQQQLEAGQIVLIDGATCTELQRRGGVARAMLVQEKPGHTVQPTDLVHEAYLRVAGAEGQDWNGRGHFFAAAAESMRRILIDQARRRKRHKHGGGRDRIDAEPQEIDDPAVRIEPPSDHVLEIDELLAKLEAADPRAREIVNLRYFAGLTTRETADALDLSVSKVEREWRFIRAWLKDRLDDAPEP